MARTLDTVGCVYGLLPIRTLDTVGCVYGLLPIRTLDTVGGVTLKRLSIREAGPIPRHGDDDGDLACVRCGCSVVLEFLSAH